MQLIPYGKQLIDEDDIAAVVEALRSELLTTGPKVTEFEQKLASTVGARYAVSFNSGTAALHGAYFAAGVGPGDEVITSPITFAATANAALYLGAKPVFVDVEAETININPQKIRAALTSKTKVIAPVDFTGNPCNLDELKEIARENGLVVVEDAAHALGATYKGRPVGSVADMTTFSFHPVKHITTGEGGAVVTDNQEYYEKLCCFRSHGIERDPELLQDYHGPWYHEMQALGYNYRLTDLQAALGISQLNKLPAFINRRREIASTYNELLAEIEGIELPNTEADAGPAWHLYVIRLKDKGLRLSLFEGLRAKGLGVQVHYLPVYWHPYYQKLGYHKGACPVAEDYYARAVSIPIFPAMTDAEVERVVLTIREEIARQGV